MEIRRLNTLRGLAALIVVVSHYSNASGLWDKALGNGAGSIGVALFFLLSGFLMSYLYFGQPANALNISNFAVARIARVIPLFYVMAIASFIAAKGYNSVLYEIDSLPLLLSHLFFLYGVSVLWTIPPEIQFYALFALGWIIHSRIGKGIYRSAVAIVFIALFFFSGNDQTTKIAGLTFSRIIFSVLPYFIAGSILGQVYHRYKIPAKARSNFYLLALLFIPLLYPTIFFNITGRYYGSWAAPPVVLLLSAIFFAVVFLVPDKNILLENAIGDFLGRVSYSLYLLQIPVLRILCRWGLQYNFWGLVLFIAAATMAAYLSYTVIEVPSRKLIRRSFSRQAA